MNDAYKNQLSTMATKTINKNDLKAVHLSILHEKLLYQVALMCLKEGVYNTAFSSKLHHSKDLNMSISMGFLWKCCKNGL